MGISQKLAWGQRLIAALVGLASFVSASAAHASEISTTGLPQTRTISIKSPKQSFNSQYYFYLLNGEIWVRSNFEKTGVLDEWKLIKAPEELKGKITEIGADGMFLFAITEDRKLHTMKNALGPIEKFEWDSRWGSPLWLDSGIRVPEEFFKWDASLLAETEDKYMFDAAGNRQWVGGGVTSVFTLSNDGQSITYLDPWLPADYSYQVCSPRHGEFLAQSISTSGSTLFVMNAAGEMYVRTYDFDFSGGDWVFFRYTYDDVHDPDLRATPQFGDLFNVINPAFGKNPDGLSQLPRKLPTLDWAKQESIPVDERTRITDRITIIKEGHGGLRVLRVEAEKEGITGYFQTLARFQEFDETGRKIRQKWTFVPTGEPIQGQWLTELKDLPSYRALPRLSYKIDTTQRGTKDRHLWWPSVRNFDVYCTPSDLEVRFANGEKLALKLHTHEVIRQFQKRNPGLPNPQEGALELHGAIELPESFDPITTVTRWFVKRYFKEKRFIPVKVFADQRNLRIEGLTYGEIVLER